MSQFRNLLNATSSMGHNETYDISESTVDPGMDVVLWDRYEKKYVGLRMSTYMEEIFDQERYETNWDVIVGVTGNTCHAIAKEDAYGNRAGMVNDDTAAARSYYRIEIDNTQAGGFTYTCVDGSTSTGGTVSWTANASMTSIRAQIPSFSYIVVEVTSDGKAIGFGSNGWSTNVVTVSNITGSVYLRDMSQYATIDDSITYNDDYDASKPVINSSYKNWCGAAARSILGADLIPIGTNSSVECNNGQDYSYRSGINKAGWRSWAASNGSGSFVSDGVNGSAANSRGNVMNKSAFDSNVTSSATGDAGKMYEYYNNLLNSSQPTWTAMRNRYQQWFGTMSDLYDAYIMSHTIRTNPTFGTTFDALNQGRRLTYAKGRTFTVTYNWKYYPAYPPEYNALHYGSTETDTKFGPGMYAHSEPYDLGLMFRDDLMSKINEVQANASVRTALNNSMYRGSVAEYYAFGTWFFDGSSRALGNDARYNDYFRARPVLAFDIRTSSNIVADLSAGDIVGGQDYIVYDRATRSYKALKGSTYDANSFDSSRYETNYDVFLGITDGVCHAVATNWADSASNAVSDNTAAAYSYYRIEPDLSQSGGFTYTAPTGGMTFTGNVSWSAGATMASVAAQITAGSYFSTAVTSDNQAIGVAVGGYGANTLTLTNVTGSVTLRDMSHYAMSSTTVNAGDAYDSTLPVINSNNKNWRGQSSQTILGSTWIPQGPNSSMIANNGVDTSWLTGVEYSGFKSWTNGNGAATFSSDGVNGSTVGGNVYGMKKSVFDANVNASASPSSDAGKMYEYYNNLLTSNSSPWKTMRETYESRYGQTMSDLYDAYMMSRMADIDATAGAMHTYRNTGRNLTNKRGIVFTVDYNWKYYPAYPQEYNCLRYGTTLINSKFKKGLYAHAEPYDLALMYRNDMMSSINTRISAKSGSQALVASNYTGSVAEYYANTTWSFAGYDRALYYNTRYNDGFRARPVLAFDI